MEPCYCGAIDCSECGVGPKEAARMEAEEAAEEEGEEIEEYFEEPDEPDEPDDWECDQAADRYYDNLFNSPY
jgi:hypothetical protein